MSRILLLLVAVAFFAGCADDPSSETPMPADIEPGSAPTSGTRAASTPAAPASAGGCGAGMSASSWTVSKLSGTLSANGETPTTWYKIVHQFSLFGTLTADGEASVFGGTRVRSYMGDPRGSVAVEHREGGLREPPETADVTRVAGEPDPSRSNIFLSLTEANGECRYMLSFAMNANATVTQPDGWEIPRTYFIAANPPEGVTGSDGAVSGSATLPVVAGHAPSSDQPHYGVREWPQGESGEASVLFELRPAP